MRVVSAHKNDIGRSQRRQNEDYIWVDDKNGLYIVADGMGGHEAGEVASKLAATTAGDFIVGRLRDKKAATLSPEAIREVMVNAAEVANKEVYEAAHQADQDRKMGTTIVIALLQPSKVYLSHAGDSRAYLLRHSELKQLTEDDSWGNFIAKTTKQDGEVAENLTHILTKAVGQHPTLEPSFAAVDIQPGDTILLCSDGLWNMIDDNQILRLLEQAEDQVDQAVDSLVEAANAAGGKDNISVVVIKIT